MRCSKWKKNLAIFLSISKSYSKEQALDNRRFKEKNSISVSTDITTGRGLLTLCLTASLICIIGYYTSSPPEKVIQQKMQVGFPGPRDKKPDNGLYPI